MRVSSQPIASSSAGVTRARRRCGKRGHERLILAVGEAVGEGAVRRDVDRDPARVALGDQRGQAGELVGLGGGVPGGLEEPAHAVAADRQPLDRPAAAGIEEDEDRAPARAHALGVEHRAHHRVFEIFARDQHPHVDILLAHQARDDRVEPLGQPGILDSGALAQGEDRRHALRDRRGGEKQSEDEEERAHQ